MAQTQIHLGNQAKDRTLTAQKVVLGTLTDAEISASAAIAFSKLAALATGKIIVGNAGVATAVTLGGDASIDAAGVLTIGPATITGSKIAASTVADGNLVESYIKANGTRAFTANQDMGGFRLTGVGSPSATGDAANKGYVDSVAQGLSIKQSVRLLADSNQTLSGLPIIDGVQTIAGDRVLLTGQTNQVQNGIFVVASGAWARSSDMAAGSSASGAFTFVEEGTVYKQTGWVCNDPAASGVVGTDNLGFTQFSSAGGGLSGTGTPDKIAKWSTSTSLTDSIMSESGSVVSVAGDVDVTGMFKVNGTQIALSDLGDGATALRTNVSKNVLTGTTITFDSGSTLNVAGTFQLGGTSVTATAAELNAVGLIVVKEVPTGAINGSNTTFTLANTPIAGSEMVELNGLGQQSGAGNDYTISGATITYLSAPQTGDKLLVSYRHH